MRMAKSFRRISWLGGVGILLGGCGSSDDGLPGGAAGTGSGAGTGGQSTAGMVGASGSGTSTGGTSGGTGSSAGSATAGASTAGAASGGQPPTAGAGGAGTSGAGAASGGAGGTGGAAGAGGRGGSAGSSGSGSGGGSSGTCTASKTTNTKASGSGPHMVVIETNSGPGIKEGTIYRPADLGGAEKYPIFVWGEGGCSQDGLSNQAAMAEIASHGYFVIADGTPGGSGNRAQTNDVVAMGKPLIAYIDWAIAENGKSCSAYYQSLDSTKVAANGYSCGGLMSEGTAADPRITTWGLNSSGLTSVNNAFYKTIHTPVLLVEGGPSDIAYKNGQRDYEGISMLTVPVMWFSKDIGHGGDLFTTRGGDFTKINLAWLNWWLKGDMGATGKGALVGASCKYCSDSAWEVKSAHLP